MRQKRGHLTFIGPPSIKLSWYRLLFLPFAIFYFLSPYYFFVNKVLRLCTTLGQCDQKKLQNIYKSCPKVISLERWHLYKNCQRMWEIWANKLLPKASKSCPKCRNRPIWSHYHLLKWIWIRFLFFQKQQKIFLSLLKIILGKVFWQKSFKKLHLMHLEGRISIGWYFLEEIKN